MYSRKPHFVSSGSFSRAVRLLPLMLALLSVTSSHGASAASLPEGIWQIGDTAIQTFNCNGLLCGKVVWLRHWRDASGRLAHDRLNPDPVQRERALCGMAVLWGLRADGPNRWTGGWLYNPDDGNTYSVNAHLRTANEFVARIYRSVPLLGATKSLIRIQRTQSAGWC